MKTERNSRQVPKVKEYTASKMYCDLMYSYLQTISYKYEENGEICRFIDKVDIVYSRLGKEIGMSRQTASKKFKDLIKLGLVIEEENRYKLKNLDKNIAWLIEYNTLRILANTMQEHVISVYIYLLKRYYANDEEEFVVYTDQIKDFIGVSTTTRSNHYIVQDSLLILNKIGLLDYDSVMVDANKRSVVIKKVYNKIEF